MESYLIIICVLSVLGIIFEHVQHKEFVQRHPDYDKCPSGVLGFVLIAVVSLIAIINRFT